MRFRLHATYYGKSIDVRDLPGLARTRIMEAADKCHLVYDETKDYLYIPDDLFPEFRKALPVNVKVEAV